MQSSKFNVSTVDAFSQFDASLNHSLNLLSCETRLQLLGVARVFFRLANETLGVLTV